MTTARDSIYAGYRHPAEIISYVVWLYFRFPLSLRMVEEMLAARGISVTYETIRQWGLKFGRAFANRIRQRASCRGDKWHLDEVVITIAGTKHWLWRAVDQEGFVLDVLVQSRRDKKARTQIRATTCKVAGISGSGRRKVACPNQTVVCLLCPPPKQEQRVAGHVTGPSRVWGSGGNYRLRVRIVGGLESLSKAGAERAVIDPTSLTN